MKPERQRDRILKNHPGCWQQLADIPDALLSEFEEGVDAGMNPRGVAMVVLRSPPGVKTDTSYEAGGRFGRLRDQFHGDDKVLASRVKQWEAKGVQVTGNEVWLDFLAQSPDDVECLAKPGEVRSTIKRIAEKRGIALDGAVKTQGRQKAPEPDKPLGYDIVTRIAKEEAKKDPSFLESTKKKRAKYEEIVEKHSFKPR